jgi:lysophospholipase L1-like esterase
VDATSAQQTYPSVLQSLLGDRFVVTNLGSSGATMQNEGYRPFVQTAMYRGLLENTWDVVVLMLGTNDGRDTEQGCDPESYMNMPCAALAAARAWFPETSPAAYVRDATSIINEVRAQHERAGAKVPTILLMTPPPVVFDGVSGVQRSIVNRIQPTLLNDVAASQNLGPVIDLHPSFGGPTLQCPLSRRDEERNGEMAATAGGLDVLIANEAKEAADPKASRFCRLAARCTLKPPPKLFRSTPPGRKDQAAHWCDYLHPSDEGYRAIAAAVQAAIMKAGFA